MPEGLIRGTKVRIMSGLYARMTETIDSNTYGATVDDPGEMSMGYGVILDDGECDILRLNQVTTRFKRSADHH